jgi:hypothetical protein
MRIKCAAIRYNGKIYEGNKHCEIGLRMINEGICETPYPSGDDQGFITECGKYVRRQPALMIALTSGQVEEGKHIHGTMLFSEDLIPSQKSDEIKKEIKEVCKEIGCSGISPELCDKQPQFCKIIKKIFKEN